MDTEKNPFAGTLGIRSIPTFHFYVNGNKVDEMMGANAPGLESKILQHRPAATQSFGGTGFTLGTVTPAWDGVGLPPGDNARAARLRAFGAMDDKNKGSAPKPEAKAEVPMETDEDEEALSAALQLSQQDEQDEAEAVAAMEQEDQAWGDDMVPVPVDEALLTELSDMGFPEIRSRKALVHGKTLDGAIAWIDEHQDDADIDQPYMVRRADIKKPLTAEERAKRTLEMKEKIVKLRQDKAKQDKAMQLQQVHLDLTLFFYCFFNTFVCVFRRKNVVNVARSWGRRKRNVIV